MQIADGNAFVDGFFQHRTRDWHEYRPECTLAEYLWMTEDEYAKWLTTGVVADRVLRVWGLT